MTELVLNGTCDISFQSDEQLLDRLSSLLKATVDSIREASVVAAELRSRGISCEALHSDLGKWLLLISDGHTTADVVVRFMGRTRLLNLIVSLPRFQQEQILRDGHVKLYTPGGDHQVVPVDSIRMRHANIVFGDGSIRSPQQQVAFQRSQTLVDGKSQQRRSTIPLDFSFLSKAEQRRIRKNADESGVGVVEYLRKILKDAGAI